MLTNKFWHPVDFSTDGSPNDYTKGATGFAIKALDSSGGGALIRQDLDPVLYKVFVDKFPLFDMIQKVPANGLTHAWNTKDAFPDAPFITETGAVGDSTSTYTRHTQNIAVLAHRVGVSLKEMYAVQQGGAGYNPEAEEIKGGITGLVHKVQAAMFRYQNADNTSVTATAPNGLYDANGFNGLRYIVANSSPSGNTVSVDLTGANAEPNSKFPVTEAIRNIADAIVDAGGDASNLAILASNVGITNLQNEQLQLVRYNNSAEVIPGVKAQVILAGDKELPLLRIPGDAVGSISNSGTFSDMYVVDMSTLKWAYLGGPTPTVLEIPIGTDGKLQKLFIPFMMGALVPMVPKFLGRVQIKTA